LITSLAR